MATFILISLGVGVYLFIIGLILGFYKKLNDNENELIEFDDDALIFFAIIWILSLPVILGIKFFHKQFGKEK